MLFHQTKLIEKTNQRSINGRAVPVIIRSLSRNVLTHYPNVVNTTTVIYHYGGEVATQFKLIRWRSRPRAVAREHERVRLQLNELRRPRGAASRRGDPVPDSPSPLWVWAHGPSQITENGEWPGLTAKQLKQGPTDTTPKSRPRDQCGP